MHRLGGLEDTDKVEAATSSRKDVQASRYRLQEEDEDSAEPQRECTFLAGTPCR